MVFFGLCRLRRPQRLTKTFTVILSASLISYFVFTFSKPRQQQPVESPPPTASVVVDPTVLSESTRASRTAGLNVYIWRGVCSSEVAHLKKLRTFPDYPDEQKIVTQFDVEDSGIDYGQRIFGFIQPVESGLHRFAISSDDTSELWLSPGEDANEKQLIASVYSKDASAWTSKGDLTKYSHQISNYIELRAGSSYYIEAIHKQGTGLGFVQVYWTNSAPGAEFRIITSEYLSTTYSDDSTITAQKDVVHRLFSLGNNSSERGIAFKNAYLDFYSLPLVTERNYLPSCVYESSFVLKNKIHQYNGVHLVYESNVYPLDDTDMGSRENVWSWPNREADKQLVNSIAEELVTALRLKTSKSYVLKRILKVLQKPDPAYGDRFSVDLEVGLEDNTSQKYRLSEHVYLPKRTHKLCFPEGIEWNNNATVYFILPVKDQGKWVYHFINQLTEASSLTGDTNFHVIVIDFESQDIDVSKAFNTSLLSSRHTVVNLQGKFYKTLALNKGVELVPSPHDIVLLFDLHIDVPADLMDSVRKNTIEGRIAYFPVVGRLDCESTADDHHGFWQLNGYGILGVYKSDWVRFGGMNTQDFKYKWGGEDWDLLDRVLNARLEVERVKQPGLFHHFHSKQKEWN